MSFIFIILILFCCLLIIHYSKEWYDPGAVTTANGALEIQLTEQKSHDLNYMGGMLTSWNKFCFTGGIIEAAVQLPGANNVAGCESRVHFVGSLSNLRQCGPLYG